MPPTTEDTRAKLQKFSRWAEHVLLILTIVVAIWAIVDARANAQKVVDAVNEQGSLEKQLEKTRTERDNLSKISLDRVFYDYNRYLGDVQKAVAAYDSAKRVPANKEGATAKKAEAERQLYVAVDAFYTFIKEWRGISNGLNSVLDGNADRPR